MPLFRHDVAYDYAAALTNDENQRWYLAGDISNEIRFAIIHNAVNRCLHRNVQNQNRLTLDELTNYLLGLDQISGFALMMGGAATAGNCFYRTEKICCSGILQRGNNCAYKCQRLMMLHINGASGIADKRAGKFHVKQQKGSEKIYMLSGGTCRG